MNSQKKIELLIILLASFGLSLRSTRPSQYSHRNSATSDTSSNSRAMAKLRSMKANIKRRVSKLGYYTREEMEIMLRDPNPYDFCSDIKGRLEFGTDISERFGRKLAQGRIKSAKADSEVTIETVVYHGKNFANCLNEVNFLRVLSNEENVVELLRCYMDGGENTEENPVKLFFVYPTIETDARKYLEKVISEEATLDERGLNRLLTDFAKGIKLLHKSNIIHRAISAETFLIDKDGRGILSYLHYLRYLNDPTKEKVDRSGVKYFKAPEVLKGLSYGKEADIFSLGIVFISFVYKKLPQDFIEDPRKPQALNLPGEGTGSLYDELLLQMSSLDKRERPTIQQVLDALTQIRAQAQGQLPDARPLQRNANQRKAKAGRPANYNLNQNRRTRNTRGQPRFKHYLLI